MSSKAAAQHVMTLRIYYEDTDAAGLVYYANYLKFAERGRTEALYALGWDFRKLSRDDGIFFVVRRCEVDFLAPAELGDIVEVRTAVARARGAGFTMDQAIGRNGRHLVKMKVDLACIGRTGKPVRLPADLREALGRLH